MTRPIARKLTIGLAVAMIAVTAAFAAIPTTRNMASAVVHDPEGLPTLTDNRVHFEPGAQECAQAVSALLDRAIADVEAAHGRPFVAPPIVAAYADDANYRAANGLGALFPAATTFRARVAMSPRVCGPERGRLQTVLTHELSHAHLQQHLSPLAYIGVPIWFLEGLAVSVSGGGGAEKISPEAARAAIATGPRIAIKDAGSVFNLVGLRFEKTDEAIAPTPAENATMAYRQAGMFVDHLRENRAAYAALMAGLLRGERFADAFAQAYGDAPHDQWARFRTTLAN
jgi:hypothetical protein